MKRVLWIVGILGLVSLSSACTNHDVAADKVRVSANAAMDSDQLAQAGEQLVSPFTFMLADKIFDMALAKNPTNQKAQFYKSFLLAPMAMKGIATRIQPFVRQYGNVQQFQDHLKQIPNSPLRDFLLDGTEDLSTTTDVQNLVVQYRDKVIEFRKYLKQNPNLEMTVYMNPFIFQRQIQAGTADSCVVKENSSNNTIVECDFSEIAQRKLNSADIVALSQMAAGQALYLTLYTSYTAEGVTDLFIADPHSQMSASARQAFLEPNSGFGKLRADHSLTAVLDFGADASAAWKYVVQNQGALCPSTNYPYEKKRKGYLFENGFCANMVNSESQKVLAILDQALQGSIPFDIKTSEHDSQVVTIDAFNGFRNPVQDLRVLLPSSYNECGKVTSLRDKTFAGIFPNADAEVVLNTRCR